MTGVSLSHFSREVQAYIDIINSCLVTFEKVVDMLYGPGMF